MVCEISQPKKGSCENGSWLRNNFAAPSSRCEIAPWLRNDFVASYPPLRKFSQLRNTPLAHECHFADPPPPHFAAAKCLRNPPRLKIPIFVAEPPFRRWFRSCETTPWHTSAISQPSTLISQLRNGLRNGCENAPPLRNLPPTAKLPICCENEKRLLASFLNVINSLFRFLIDQLQIGVKEEPNQSNSPSDPST